MSKALSDLDQYKYQNELSLQSKLARLLWNLIWALLFRPTPSWCMTRWRLWLLRVFGAKVGKGCRVAPSCRFWAPWNVTMGDYVCLGDGVDCYSVAPIKVGNKVTVSQQAVLCTGSHDISSLKRPLISQPIIIEDHVWVCAGAFIAPGVSLGEGAVVGARGVVIKDIKPWTVVGGNPARFIKDRKLHEEKEMM